MRTALYIYGPTKPISRCGRGVRFLDIEVSPCNDLVYSKTSYYICHQFQVDGTARRIFNNGHWFGVLLSAEGFSASEGADNNTPG